MLAKRRWQRHVRSETLYCIKFVVVPAERSESRDPVPSTQYPVPSTQYPVPSTQYPVLCALARKRSTGSPLSGSPRKSLRYSSAVGHSCVRDFRGCPARGRQDRDRQRFTRSIVWQVATIDLDGLSPLCTKHFSMRSGETSVM